MCRVLRGRQRRKGKSALQRHAVRPLISFPGRLQSIISLLWPYPRTRMAPDGALLFKVIVGRLHGVLVGG